MKAIDMHSHFSTRKGYLWQTPEELAKMEEAYRCKVNYRSEEEMAQDLRDAGIKAIFDFAFTTKIPIEEVREYHDYAAQLKRDYPDVFLGIWVCIDPRSGLKGLRELERCLKDLGMVGFKITAVGQGIPPSDRVFYPFYDMCIEAGAPVHISVGYTTWGAGLPGGGGLCLEFAHPRYVDEVAAKFPDLKIIAARPAWPWQDEMIAVLLHKPNIVGYELHGWSPKYFAPELKWDINHRLKDKIMFGADYPMFSYERLFRDWESLGYSQEILEKVYYKNALAFLERLGYKLA